MRLEHMIGFTIIALLAIDVYITWRTYNELASHH